MKSDLWDSSIRLKISSDSSQKFPAVSARLSDLYDSSLALKEFTEGASFTVDGSLFQYLAFGNSIWEKIKFLCCSTS